MNKNTGRRKPIMLRIMEKVHHIPFCGCWIFTGAWNRAGYGQIGRGGAGEVFGLVLVHRTVYEHLVGPIPEGLVLDHLCRMPACCNPDHLEPVTMRENSLRGVGICAREAKQTHCLRGHEFNAENTYVKKDGGRQCRICQNERFRLARKRKRTEHLPEDY